VSRARCRHGLHPAACAWCARPSPGPARPLRPMAVVVAWYPTLCHHPACGYRPDPGEPVGLVSRLGPCCAGCCALPHPHPRHLDRDRAAHHAVTAPAQKRSHHMAPPHPTSAERRLVEQYVWVLDFVSRCAQGIDTADWFYLADKSGQLAAAAERTSSIAFEVHQTIAQAVPRRAERELVRAEGVRAAVAHYGRGDRAGQLLHPPGGAR
jgi:hypothetical protein